MSNSYYRAVSPDQLTILELGECSSKTIDIMDRVAAWFDSGVSRENAKSTLNCQHHTISLQDAAGHLGMIVDPSVRRDELCTYIVNTIYNSLEIKTVKRTMGQMMAFVRECEKLPDTNSWIPVGDYNLERDAA